MLIDIADHLHAGGQGTPSLFPPPQPEASDEAAHAFLAHAVCHLAGSLDSTSLSVRTFEATVDLRNTLDSHILAARTLAELGSVRGARQVLEQAVALVLASPLLASLHA